MALKSNKETTEKWSKFEKVVKTPCRREREDLPTPHNNPIISLINDVMKANTVKIAVNSWI